MSRMKVRLRKAILDSCARGKIIAFSYHSAISGSNAYNTFSVLFNKYILGGLLVIGEERTVWQYTAHTLT